MHDPALIKLMDVLNDSHAMQTLLVGGCVRNWLLGTDVSDIDLASLHTPDTVIARGQAAGFKVIPTGLDHGTVTVVVDGTSFEVTTLRKDVETDGRRAVVAFTDDWREDAQRRDFTINALYADLSGHIYDPLGHSMKDIKKRRVVFVGDATTRIAEDALRILRFFRFYGAYGAYGGAVDEEGVKACQDAADQIKTLSRERVSQEFFKIVMLDNAADILVLMRQKGILVPVIPNQITFPNKTNLSARLYTLMHYDPAKLTAFQDTLIIPNTLQKQIRAIDAVLHLPPMDHDHAVKVAVYKHGRDAARQALLIAKIKGDVPDSYMDTALNLIETWDIPTFPITGHDLIAKGQKPGSELGARLKKLEEEWIESGFDNPV